MSVDVTPPPVNWRVIYIAIATAAFALSIAYLAAP